VGIGISELGIATLPRLLAVEVLLAEPEALRDDVLESCLYLLRDRLRSVGENGARPTGTGERVVLRAAQQVINSKQSNRDS
jgi:hypothetical protein